MSPLPTVTRLAPRHRALWGMLGAHLAAGHRLRRAVEASDVSYPDQVDQAEAVLDPHDFEVRHARGPAKTRDSTSMLRMAALRVDKARGKLRRSDPDEALALWQGLVHGRWSLIDWFDTDGRRFVLAKPNAPNLGDPRGLSGREHQVVTYAAQGESVKLVAYRLGLSQNRVSSLLRSAMRKLGVKTHPRLVEKMRAMPPVKRGPGPTGDPGDPTDVD